MTSKLKESEDHKLRLEKLNEVQQREICELTNTRDALEDKQHCVEKAQKNSIKSIINAEKLLEEQKKLMEEIKYSRKIYMKIKLQSYTDTASLVKSMKQKISHLNLCESENDLLEKAFETKENVQNNF